jgi:hypothetical protein
LSINEAAMAIGQNAGTPVRENSEALTDGFGRMRRFPEIGCAGKMQ